MEVLKDRPEVINLLESVAENEKITKLVILDVKTNRKGEGYLGQIFMVTIGDSANEKKLDLVVKLAFPDEKLRGLVPIVYCFENEIYFYNEVYPCFKKFEKERGISEIKFVPKCYKTSNEIGREMLCLENMKPLGFDVFERTNILDHDHVSLIFKTYGRFHAYSFALQDQKPEEYARISSKFHNIYHKFIHNPLGKFNIHLQQFIELVGTYLSAEEDKEVLEKFKKYLGPAVIDHYAESSEEKCDYSVILHGDSWSNNMLFKYENKKPVDMCLLDLQCVRVGSPVCDLSYVLYSGGSKEVYDNLQEYLKMYYDSFCSFLRELGSDPEKLFPFCVLKDHWKKYAKFGMIQSVMIWKMKATNQEDILDLQDVDENDPKSILDFKFDKEVYRFRIKEVVCHMSDIDVL